MTKFLSYSLKVILFLAIIMLSNQEISIAKSKNKNVPLTANPWSADKESGAKTEHNGFGKNAVIHVFADFEWLKRCIWA